MSQNKARGKPKTPSGGGGTLFSYFKPKTPSSAATCDSPTPSTNGKQAAVTPHHASTNGKHATPSRKRKNDEGSNTPLTPCLPRAVLCEDDSNGEVGVRKNLSGRPKRRASMPVSERRRVHKRVRRMTDSDSSGEEYRPETESCNEQEMESWSNSEEEVTNDEPTKKSKLMTPLSTPKLSTVSTPTSKTGTPRTPHNAVTPLSICSPATPSSTETGKMFHETLHWLKDENRRDKAGCRANDPNYNPRTLQVPADFLRKQTPAMKQWWIIKSDNFDTALFFKVGKFYELYHMDAVIGVQELGLVFMKGSFAHSGFPEIAFSRYAQTLVQKGYKVARVEQTETPQMMEERTKNSIKSPSRNDRVVRREVCSHVSKGTRTMGFSDGVELEAESSFLLAVKEKTHCGAHNDLVFGVCFVDTCIGTFHLGQFADDRQCSRLRTLLAHYPPAQILYERGNLSQQVLQLFNKRMASVIKDSLIPGSEYWTSEHTLKLIANEGYFDNEELAGSSNGIMCSGKDTWPKVLTDMLSEEHSLGLSPREDCDLAVSALGACLWCLRRSLIDKELLQMESFERYNPPDVMIDQCTLNTDNAGLVKQRMVLDDVTLVNLDVLDPNGRCAGTLLDKLDNCSTAFGKRLLKQWLCAPLCSPAAINSRLDAVTLLSHNPSLVSSVVSVLKSLPDLQRLLRRIQTVGSKARTIDHPDSRAILYEETTYSKRKLIDFLSVLDGFTNAKKMPLFFQDTDLSSSQLLQALVTTTDSNGNFPDMSKTLSFFNEAFDHKNARKNGIILPHKGVNKQYDQALSDISRIDQLLEDYLNRQRKRLACKSIVYWGSGRNRYQLEVPESALARHTPDEYELKSQRKGFRRYWTKETERLLGEMTNAEERKNSALKDTMRTVFHSFSQHFQMWESVVACLATLDVLIAMATYSSGGEMCRPKVTLASPDQSPYVDIRSGRHPCVNLSGEDFIPNDLIINCNEPLRSSSSCVVVTGPNMGGKSTLLRQTGLIVILAQMGCYVPAGSCSLTPVDRIFTRLGALDKIMQGESTFYVELSETSVILRHSTRNSLVLLDELGRGTATYDGTAIASAVVHELAHVRACRTLFSTHYHSLVDEFANDHAFQLGHMACMVENDDEDGEESITFLYRFVEGACPKSYGFNVARLAGLPQQVVASARRKAKEFENSTQRQRLFRLLMSSEKCKDNVRSLHKQLASICI